MPSNRSTRLRIRVRGTVQGVGFRPAVYRLARSFGLAGFVLNDDDGVLIEIEGDDHHVRAFSNGLAAAAPPLARIDRIETSRVPPDGAAGFTIEHSDAGRGAPTPVTPDAATCEACLSELEDPADRRYRYPFINCTDCGPRFTIVRETPYDRPATTMAGFAMCEACRSEYEDPVSRRFHAQPNACPACGPAVRLVDPAGRAYSAGDAGTGVGGRVEDTVSRAAGLLRDGRILAVKGLGGYHLACRADDADAVLRLRVSKHRKEKPFALMVSDLAAAGALVELDDGVRAALRSPERPIVLSPRRAEAAVAEGVAPGARELGVMLPYSPLHHLLLADLGRPLVLTSGNVSDEPIAYTDEDALRRLGGLVDGFLMHDRAIHVRTDDSVVRSISGGRRGRARRGTIMLLRRSRGYVPLPLELPVRTPPLLACGGQLKSTFCLAEGDRAWVSHHIGDLENLETLESYRSGIDHFLRLFRVRPVAVAHDLHPDYLSTRYALELGLPEVGVQHHHAHHAACLAEHGETGPAIGVAYDGTGYGADGTIWGGEILVGDLRTFRRAGHLLPVPMPGGAAAIREPWRMACAWLGAAGLEGSATAAALRERAGAKRWDAVAQMARTGLNAPLTSSVGRLFDAVAALCGIRLEVTYEGQAAIELERAADPAANSGYQFGLAEKEGCLVLDPVPALTELVGEIEAGEGVGRASARFHTGLADVTVRAVVEVAGATGLDGVTVGGGALQNVRLLRSLARGLAGARLRVLVPERVPPNDGGLSFGQAAVAAARYGAGA